MAFPTTNAQRELPAVNTILQSCGQAPVTTLDQTNPDVAIAYQTLLEVSREVQAEGWSYNKEYHYDMTPDTNKQIPIANNNDILIIESVIKLVLILLINCLLEYILSPL